MLDITYVDNLVIPVELDRPQLKTQVQIGIEEA
jgi:hypothetical protein